MTYSLDIYLGRRFDRNYFSILFVGLEGAGVLQRKDLVGGEEVRMFIFEDSVCFRVANMPLELFTGLNWSPDSRKF